MKILVTGNQGYIGTVLCGQLIEKSYDVIGYDVDYYHGCELEPMNQPFRQITKDIRDIEIDDIKKVDAIIHLAALSNDPLGDISPSLTEAINLESTIKLAKLAKAAGVQRFIYSSSQSMYGISDSDKELEEDNSDKNPVTAYAKTKWEAETELKKMNSPEFMVTCFRPSTVFGASPRLRCDIVFNNLTACAYTTGKIEILSDGSPWRPVVHIKDVCQAFLAGVEAPAEIVGGKSFNVGIQNGNFTVRDLAQAAQRSVPGCDLVFLNEHTDPRTYKVSFKRILNELSDFYKPEWDLDKGGRELVDYFDRVKLTEDDFRGKKCNRLKQLEYLKEHNKLNGDLKWI